VLLVAFPDERPVSLIDRVREEWPLDGADVDADVRAWRDGAELYEDCDDDELLAAGELMARAVRHHVHGGRALREDDLAVTVHSLLFAAGTPAPDDAGIPLRACRLARLALAVIAQQGWQPPQLGGNGHITAEIFEDADIHRLLTAALAPDADLAAFFLMSGARWTT
jgi:hypothetical protein